MRELKNKYFLFKGIRSCGQVNKNSQPKHVHKLYNWRHVVNNSGCIYGCRQQLIKLLAQANHLATNHQRSNISLD